MKLYPTIQHKKAVEKMVEKLRKDKTIMAILLIGSCARGKASKDSCLDIVLIVKSSQANLYKKYGKIISSIKEVKELRRIGKYSHVDLLIREGKIKPKERGWTSGPDEFELEIGNLFKYSVVLFDRDNYFKKISKKYLPYYDEKLRRKKLEEVKKYCLNNLDHVPPYVKRKLYFQAFDRLYKANQEFMQLLFISKRIYPIAYDKWIKEQFINILKMPKMYKIFKENVQIKNLESNEIEKKARRLRKIVERLS